MQEKRIYQIIKKNNKEISNYKEFLELLLINSFLKDPTLLNPIVVKLSLNDELYNYYLLNLLKCSREEYFNKVLELLKDEKVAINYISKNIDIMDHENEIDKIAALTYFSKLKEKIDLSKKEVRFFVKYITYKKAHEKKVSVKVLSVNIAEYNKFSKKQNRAFSLENEARGDNWYGMCNSNGDKRYIIYINREQYNNDKIIKNTEAALLNLITTCYHELQHSIKSNEATESMNRLDYRIWKENFLPNFDYAAYNKNHVIMESEIDAHIAADIMLLQDFESGFFKEFARYKDGLEKMLSRKKMVRTIEEYYALEDIIDSIIFENNSQIHRTRMFDIEYNKAGKRNDIFTLLMLKNRHLDPYEKKVNDLKEMYVNEKLDSEDRRIVSDSIKKSEPILNNLKEFYNQIIFKALLKRPNDGFLGFLSRSELETVYNALNAEMKIVDNNIIINNEVFLSVERQEKNKVFLEKRKQEIIDLLELIKEKNKER